MRRAIIALLSITTLTLQAHAQQLSMIRAEIAAPLASLTTRFAFGHQISRNWSIEAEIGINLKRLIKAKEDETLTHWSTLSDLHCTGSERKFRNDLTEIRFCTQYWPKQIYAGPVFSMGGVLKNRSGADIISGCGYIFHIWKGLRADLQYQIHIIESIKTSKISPYGIRIGISYVFQ